MVIAFVVLMALAAPLVAPDNPLQPTGPPLLVPASAGHLLGTDSLGRDQLSRLIYGSRTILLASAGSVALSMLLGAFIGLVAGYGHRALAVALMRLVDVLLSFPLILLGIMIVAVLGTGLLNVILAITVALTPIFARLIYGLALSESKREYVTAARAAGMNVPRILLTEILPNLAGPIIVQATSLFAIAAGFSTALSYLGLGVQPPQPDWGLMVSNGQEFIYSAPALALIPGALITLLLVAVTFAGDSLRERFDPHRLLEVGGPR